MGAESQLSFTSTAPATHEAPVHCIQSNSSSVMQCNTATVHNAPTMQLLARLQCIAYSVADTVQYYALNCSGCSAVEPAVGSECPEKIRGRFCCSGRPVTLSRVFHHLLVRKSGSGDGYLLWLALFLALSRARSSGYSKDHLLVRKSGSGDGFSNLLWLALVLALTL